MSDRSSSPGDPPEPYAPNSDVSAASSPLLPFGNKKLQEDDQEDQQWTSGGGDPSGGSPDYTGVASGEKSAPRFGSNLNDDSAAQGQADENGQPGPSRKRPRLDDSNSSSHQTSAQQVAPAIPFPHQLPLPDHSKSIYLSGLDELARTRGAALKPYHPVPRVIMNSLFGFTPRNEVSKEVGEWLMMTCANLPGHVEIEIKFGQILLPQDRRRLRLPVKTETLIDETQIQVAFQSDMPMWAHSGMNSILNTQVTQSTDRNGHPSYPPHSYHRLEYSHTHTEDTSFPASSAPGQNSIPVPQSMDFIQRHGYGKRRLSRKSGSGEVVECLQKVKVGNLHVYCPMEAFDFRISVNCEFPCNPPAPNEMYENKRKKDRISYKHNLFQIDLTQVRSFNSRGTGGDLTHELELEILDARKMLTYGFNASHGQDPENRWEESMDCVLNTVRLLNKNVQPPAPSGVGP